MSWISRVSLQENLRTVETRVRSESLGECCWGLDEPAPSHTMLCREGSGWSRLAPVFRELQRVD